MLVFPNKGMKEINKGGRQTQEIWELSLWWKGRETQEKKRCQWYHSSILAHQQHVHWCVTLPLLLNHSLLIKSFLFETFNNGSGN